MVTRVTSCLAVTILLSVIPAAAQPEPIDELLAMKPSPGVEALLLAHARDGRVGRRWMQLLQSPEPRLRLAAARGLGIARVRTAATPLLEALAREQDEAVLAEILQALATVGTDESLPRIYAQLHRIGDDRAVPLLDGLAAARPTVVAEHLRSAEPLRAHDAWVAAIYARLAHASPASADGIDADLGKATANPILLEGVVRGATMAKRQLPAGLVQAALRLSPAARLATLAYLAAVHGSPARVPALGTPAQNAPASEPAEAKWIRELERRWLGGEPAGTLVDVAAALPDVAWVRQTPGAVLTVLSAEERAAFARRYSLSEQAMRALLGAGQADPTPPADPAEYVPPVITLLTSPPADMLAEVVRLAKCEPGTGDEQVTSAQYRADRRPAALTIERQGWSPGCFRAAWAALGLTYGPPPRTADERTHWFVRLDPEFTSCLADRQAATAAVAEGAGEWGVAPPRKTRDVRPEYPEAAVRARLQGVVQIEARIERSGCVSEARVVRPVHPMLDEPALRAVSRWRYTPTTLNGEPVPVVMNVDVTFALR